MSAEEILSERERLRASLEIEVGTGDDCKRLVPKAHVATTAIYAADPVLQHLGTNTMGGGLAWRVLPPWRPAGSELRSVNNHDLAMIDETLCWYFGGGHASLSQRACDQARTAHAGGHTFSPWRDYIDALPEWDGVERIPDAIPTVRGAGSAYTKQVQLNFFLGMAARAYAPGCQLDSMIVLYGGQGMRKTTWVKAIAPADLPVAELSSIPDDHEAKDLMRKAHAAPIALIDEMDKLRRRDDQAGLKAFITGRRDTWRSPYGRVEETHARQFALAGTTNKEEFLLDTTGNRRYWVLAIAAPIPDERLTREYMDLLLAEARDRYHDGQRVDYSPEFEALADEVRSAHLDDPVRDAVWAWLDEPRLLDSPVPVDASKVAVPFLCANISEFSQLRATNAADRVKIEKIEAAMDAHPRYRRMAGRPRIGGKQHRKAWEQIAAPPSGLVDPHLAGPQSERDEQLLNWSRQLRATGSDPANAPLCALAFRWDEEQIWDEAARDACERAAVAQAAAREQARAGAAQAIADGHTAHCLSIGKDYGSQFVTSDDGAIAFRAFRPKLRDMSPWDPVAQTYNGAPALAADDVKTVLACMEWAPGEIPGWVDGVLGRREGASS